MTPEPTSDPRLVACKVRVDEWLRRLVDLSRRNRLLYHKATKRQSLDLLDPGAQEIVNQLLAGREWRFWLPPEPRDVDETAEAEELLLDASEVVEHPRRANEIRTSAPTPNDLQRTLETLQRRAAADFEERGVQILHLALGLLRWHDPEHDEDVRSPLILIPVRLERDRIGQPYTLRRSEEEAIINPTLSVKLERTFGIELPEIGGSLEDDDDDDYELTDYFQAVSRLNTAWAVEPAAVLGLYTFFKEVIYRDLKDHWEIAIENGLVGALASGEPIVGDSDPLAENEDLDAIRPPKDSLSVLDADSSQLLCLEASRRGESLVIQGPPGTGKSQTITNLIGEAIGRGQSVLFVSEKMAALEVVYKRLTEAGLADFCLELHSHKVKKSEVARNLGAALANRVRARRGLARDQLEQLRQARDSLNEYVRALHERREPLAMTAFEAEGLVANLSGAPRLAGPRLDSLVEDGATYVNGLSSFERLERYLTATASTGGSPWSGFNRREFDQTIRQTLLDVVRAASGAFEALQAASAQYAGALGEPNPPTVDAANRLANVACIVSESRPCPATWLFEDDLAELGKAADMWTRQSAAIRTQREGLSATFQQVPDRSLATELIAALDASRELMLDPDEALFEASNDAVSHLKAARDASAAAHAAVQTIGDELGFAPEQVESTQVPGLVAAGKALASANRPPSEWLAPARFQEAERFVDERRTNYTAERELTVALSRHYTDAFVELGPIADRYAIASGKLLGRFGGAHRADRAAVRSASRDGRIPDTIVDDLAAARQLLDYRQAIARDEPAARVALGHLAQGTSTDLPLVEEMLRARTAITDALLERADIGKLERVLRDGAGLQFQLATDQLAQAHHHLASESAGLDGAAPRVQPDRLGRLRDTFDRCIGALGRLAAARALIESGRLSTASDLATLRHDCVEIVALTESIDGFARARSELSTRFPGLDVSAEADWSATAESVHWAKRMRDGWPGPITPRLAQHLTAAGFEPPERDDLETKARAAVGAIGEIASQFDPDVADHHREALSGSWDEVRSHATALTDRVDDVGTWIDYATAREAILSGRWAQFLERLEQEAVSPKDIVPAFRRAYHVSWLEDVFRRDDRLGKFRGRDHETLVEEFRRLDRQLIQHAREVVIHRCNQKRPSLSALPGSETAVVSKEASKRRRHKPIRRLFAEIPHLLPALKPCLLMSPLSVSQFLDPRTRFDLVIFDEASQVTVEDAICALYRGSRHAIAGDSKQLPPTGFFRVTEDDDDADDDWESEANWESVLDRAEGSGLRAVPLRWHYRSRHESLIAYSNRAFYASRLVTFPSTWAEHPGLGVQFYHVTDGVYDRGGSRTNRREAEAVCRLVFEHMRVLPEKSLGVVTFNDAQRVAVQDAVDRYRYEHREFEDHFREDRLDGFFVKNLENVQGDERDCMIFSVTYGRDAVGKFTLNFGPVSQRGGERRLNVAITRAREKVVIVSSLRAADFPVSAELNGGSLHLRSYLDYAERGEAALIAGTESSEGDFESTFEEAVAAAIRELGYQVVPQVGVSGFRVDLGVVHPDEPGRFILGIECDGAAYHSAATARDRDRLRQDILEDLGWRIERVWSPDWNANSRQAVDRLNAAIEEALAVPAPSIGSAAPSAIEVRDTFELVGDVEDPADESGYPTPPPDIGTVPRSVISEAVIGVVARSFSIERGLLVQQVARRLGYRRTGARIQDAIGLTITSLLRAKRILNEQGSITLPKVEASDDLLDAIPDWDAVIGDQPRREVVPDIEEANEERIAPPDGNGLLILRSDMPLLELEVQLIKVVSATESPHGTPDDGNRLVAGQFSIRNRGRVVYEPYRSGARWTARDGQGNMLGTTTLRIDPSLHATRVRPGAVGTGFITFELASTASLDAIMFAPSSQSDTGIWPDVWRSIENTGVPQDGAKTRDAPEAASSGERRVDVMSLSSSGATVSIAIDAPNVTEAVELLDAAGVKLKAGSRYVSERRGQRQTLLIETGAFGKAMRALEAAGFDVRLGPLRP